MTYYERLRRDWRIVRELADQLEARELAECALADVRVRLREISPTLSGQLEPQQAV